MDIEQQIKQWRDVHAIAAANIVRLELLRDKPKKLTKKQEQIALMEELKMKFLINQEKLQLRRQQREQAKLGGANSRPVNKSK